MSESNLGIQGGGRVASIDALRGFDMFWITGGEGIIHSLYRVFPNPVTDTFHQQFRHVRWAGFHFYDLIFPLFLFIVGLVLPFSLTRRLERGANRGELHWHAVRRLLLLFLLGLIYNGLLDFNFHELRIAGVLQRIAICNFIAALIVMNTSIRQQVIAAGAILVGYWVILLVIPVPGVGAGVLTPEGNLAAYLDRLLLPGRFCCYQFGDNEGILSTLPAVGTTLMGALAGHWLRSSQSSARKVRGLALAGVACVVAGYVWGLAFPIIKNMWTSTFVLVAGGWSLLLLAGFYWVIDMRGYRRWAYFFTVIGMNAITVYVADRLFRFRIVTDIFVHGFIDYLGPFKPLFYSVCVAATIWLFLWFLHRQKIYLKV